MRGFGRDAQLLCRTSVVLVHDGAEDKQKGKQLHGVDLEAALVSLARKSTTAVEPLHDKRQPKCEDLHKDEPIDP
jgi:hypothetical protein